ncbi:g5147 [Coccomyxa elongata]
MCSTHWAPLQTLNRVGPLLFAQSAQKGRAREYIEIMSAGQCLNALFLALCLAACRADTPSEGSQQLVASEGWGPDLQSGIIEGAEQSVERAIGAKIELGTTVFGNILHKGMTSTALLQSSFPPTTFPKTTALFRRQPLPKHRGVIYNLFAKLVSAVNPSQKHKIAIHNPFAKLVSTVNLSKHYSQHTSTADNNHPHDIPLTNKHSSSDNNSRNRVCVSALQFHEHYPDIHRTRNGQLPLPSGRRASNQPGAGGGGLSAVYTNGQNTPTIVAGGGGGGGGTGFDPSFFLA